MWRAESGAADRGVGCDDSFEAAFHRERSRALHVLFARVWINFYGYWLASESLSFVSHSLKQRAHTGLGLQVPQSRSVGRRNVHRDVVDHGVHGVEGREVVVDRLFVGGGFVAAYVAAHDEVAVL